MAGDKERVSEGFPSSLCLVPECPAGLAERSGDGPAGPSESAPAGPCSFVSAPAGVSHSLRFLSGRSGGGDNGRLSDHSWSRFKNVAAGMGLRSVLTLAGWGRGWGGEMDTAKGLVDHPRSRVHHHAESNMSKQE